MATEATKVNASEVVCTAGRQERLATFAATWIRRQIAPGWDLPRICLCGVCQPEAGQRHAGETDTEFLQRPAPCDGLGHALGEFIEWVVHTLFVTVFNHG